MSVDLYFVNDVLSYSFIDLVSVPTYKIRNLWHWERLTCTVRRILVDMKRSDAYLALTYLDLCRSRSITTRESMQLTTSFTGLDQEALLNLK